MQFLFISVSQVASVETIVDENGMMRMRQARDGQNQSGRILADANADSVATQSLTRTSSLESSADLYSKRTSHSNIWNYVELGYFFRAVWTLCFFSQDVCVAVVRDVLKYLT